MLSLQWEQRLRAHGFLGKEGGGRGAGPWQSIRPKEDLDMYLHLGGLMLLNIIAI